MENIFKGFLRGLGCLGCLILFPLVLVVSPVIALFLAVWGVFEILLILYTMSLWADQGSDNPDPTNSDIIKKNQDTSLP